MNNEIIKDYISGSSMIDILNKYKIGHRKLTNILKSKNIEIRGKKINHELIKNTICENYLLGQSINHISSTYKMAPKSIIKILITNNIEIRPRGSWLIGKRQDRCIEFDYDFFKNRNNIVAYYAGILIADGSLGSTRNKISLGVTDPEITYGFAKSLQLPPDRVKIRQKSGNRKLVYELNIQHGNFAKDLEYWGIQPRKTYDFLEPKVSLELLPDFLRGWFDGDGSLSSINTPRVLFRITGNKDGLEYYKQCLIKLGYDSFSNIHPGHTDIYGHLHIAGRKQVQKVLDIIKGSPFLQRKKDKFISGNFTL